MRGKFILMPIFFVLMGIAMTLVVMLLWNWLMPVLFGLSVITFWQALGVLVLSKILFGGHWGKRGHCCHGGYGHSHSAWKEKFKSKWQNMSDEDRRKWEEKFCGSKWQHTTTSSSDSVEAEK
ncbi:MAG: hypothetical protein HYZ14_16835 [Bacteroidetes bacterium]|nr:hypothetical protein [Bacteroidota bacterium]